MNREVFKEQFEDAKKEKPITYVKDCEELHGVIDWCLYNAKKNYMKDPNMNDLAVVIEEMSELTQELTKMLRGKGDMTGLLEELADVQIGTLLVMRMFNISEDDLNRAIQVKVDRQNKKKERGREW